MSKVPGMQTEGLKQSPLPKIIYVPAKVETGEVPSINADINLWDVIRLGFRKAIENKAFGQYQISTGKVIAVTGCGAIGIGSFASINWGGLITGNVFEWIKLAVAIAGALVALFWKK